MEIIFMVFFIICILAMIFLILGLVANNITYNQRKKLIHYISEKDISKIEEFENVNYNDHLWSLIKFRDPKKLYKENIRKKMGWE